MILIHFITSVINLDRLRLDLISFFSFLRAKSAMKGEAIMLLRYVIHGIYSSVYLFVSMNSPNPHVSYPSLDHTP